MKHKNIYVKGKVQGVWFRASTQEEAVRLGIHGFVRNEPDGGVYLEAEGEQEQLDSLLAWLKIGPPQAEVDSIEDEESEMKHFNGFEIRR